MKKLSLALIICVLAALAAPLAQANPERWAREGWKTDFAQKSIDLKDILSGGIGRDVIPPIDKPKFKTIDEVAHVKDTEPVVGVEISGDARAYPLQMMTWHEIVNDQFGAVPVAVTYCPLCNSAIVFERTVGGKVLDFGTTGKLRNSDLVMYDRQTQSWWQQFIGEAIVGEMTGEKLKSIPARLESYANFKARFPNGKVLVPNNDGLRAYGRNPYAGYDSARSPFLYNGEMPEGIEPMARVVAYRVDGKLQALALSLLAKQERVEIGDVEFTWSKGQNSALDTRVIAEGRDVGNIVVRKKTGGVLKDMVYDVTFAFVVNAFRPGIAIKK
ncbi:MAG: DUF3179 domain-containing protein [Alphaproteobacteria bacterium]|nr:DUF3179 domain-containing protein [Alphaproteobacteria bacterium]